MTDHYDQLAKWAESDEPSIAPGAAVRRGEAARDSARNLLERATENDPVERARLRRVTGGEEHSDPAPNDDAC